MLPVRVKVCCISSVAEAELAVAAGASALGLVSAMPSGPGVIDEGLIARIAAHVPPTVATFLLTAANVAEAVAIVRPYGVDLCNGVREAGALSARSLDAFMAAVRGEAPAAR